MSAVPEREQVERIERMERLLSEGADALCALEAALERYARSRDGIAELSSYYESPTWLRDHDDDAAGLLPDGLARGVLSEDAIWDLLTDEARLRERMRELSDAT